MPPNSGATARDSEGAAQEWPAAAADNARRLRVSSNAQATALQTSANTDPSGLWGPLAARSLYFFHDQRRAWLRLDQASGQWLGWAADGASAAGLSGGGAAWSPWGAVVRQEGGPHTARWFVGAKTNAAFNECDEPVLAGGGAETAFICEPVSGPARRLSRRELLLRSTLAARALRDALGTTPSPRIAVHLPNGEEAVVWIQVRALPPPHTLTRERAAPARRARPPRARRDALRPAARRRQPSGSACPSSRSRRAPPP